MAVGSVVMMRSIVAVGLGEATYRYHPCTTTEGMCLTRGLSLSLFLWSISSFVAWSECIISFAERRWCTPSERPAPIWASAARSSRKWDKKIQIVDEDRYTMKDIGRSDTDKSISTIGWYIEFISKASGAPRLRPRVGIMLRRRSKKPLSGTKYLLE